MLTRSLFLNVEVSCALVLEASNDEITPAPEASASMDQRPIMS